MFKNLKIRDKLFAAFGLVITMLTICGVCFFVVLNSTAQNFTVFHDEAFALSTKTNAVKADINRLSNSICKAVMAPTKELAETYIEETNSEIASLDDSLNELRERTDSGDFIAKVDELQELIDTIEKRSVKLFELCKQLRTSWAVEMYYEQFDELLIEVDRVTTALNQLAERDAGIIYSDSKSMISMGKTLIAVVCIACFAVAIVVALFITKRLVTPINQLKDVAKALSEGQLKGADEIVTYESRDELGQLADAMRFSMKTIDDYVAEISALLEQLASGDLTIPLNEVTDYLGDFASIKVSMGTILTSFNTAITDIYTASMQVDVGSEQVSSGAQALSQGATEQASAVEQLSATIAEVSNHINANAQNAVNASKMSDEAGKGVMESNKYMQQLMDAMEEINRTTGQIEKIIKTIEDIAFQTNILALNAAVEAARAGAAGKGFAVVADEVRSLAAKSAEAAKNTNALIGSTVGAVRNGMNVADETSKALQEVVEKTRTVNDRIGEIAAGSAEQAEKIEQISNGIEQIAAVVHNNSATAEQSAAASEELASQAALMKEQIGKFRLYDGSTNDYSYTEEASAEDEYVPAYESFENNFAPVGEKY